MSMKVSNSGHINLSFGALDKQKEDNKSALAQHSNESHLEVGVNDAYGKAFVGLHNNNVSCAKSSAKVLDDIAQQYGYKVYRSHGDKIIRAKAGDLIPQWKDLYNEKLSLCAYKDIYGAISEIYALDYESGEITVYDSEGNCTKFYTADEKKALRDYKYHPENIHNFLRYNRQPCLQSENDLWNIIHNIDNCFKQENKVFKTDKPMTVYRALPFRISESDKKLLTTSGYVYRDNSFASATKKLVTAKHFRRPNGLIMEISLPVNSKYLDMDKLFNIDSRHWEEDEMLLNRGSRFVITGFDPENNIVKATYLSK